MTDFSQILSAMERTMSSMLSGAPWLLAHKSILQVNRPQMISLYGADYVMWKDAAGDVHALPNACPHMGAMLSEGWCEEKHASPSRVVCPFHALEFDPNGCTQLPGSGKTTKPLLQPLELIVQGDFIWSYGHQQPQIPIPQILNEFSSQYEFIGYTGEYSVETDLLSMLLNMHDYNHQNGTHRSLFEIQEVRFTQFIDRGLHSHAYYHMPRAKPKLQDILKNPALLTLPKVLEAHLENYFPSLVIFHGESSIAEIKQCHIFVPESETHTRTYVLVFFQARSPFAHLAKKKILELAAIVVEQDTHVLGKIYPEIPQTIKLNNEVGMDWVRRNFDSFPNVAEPNLSR